MQAINRRLVEPPVSSREAFAALDAAKTEPVALTGRGLLVEQARGYFRKQGDNPASFVADPDSVIEIEPGAHPTCLVVWQWEKDGHVGCTFVELDDAERLAGDIFAYVARQRARAGD